MLLITVKVVAWASPIRSSTGAMGRDPSLANFDQTHGASIMKTLALAALSASTALTVPARAGDAGVTRIADLIVPEIFTPTVQNLTTERSRLVQSGAVTVDAELSNLLSGGGLTFSQGGFRDLDDDEENISNDDPTDLSTPNKIGTLTEIQVRLSRNNSWSSMDLAADLAGVDPMNAIANRVGAYWARRLQTAFIAEINGIFADNALAPAGGDTHTQNDLTHDISGVAFDDDVTNIGGAAFISAFATMGDMMDELTMVMMHSVPFTRLLTDGLIVYGVNPREPDSAQIPFYLGREVIVDDKVTNAAGVFDTWLFGRDAFRLGNGLPRVPTEVSRVAAAGNGSGQEVLHSRLEWVIHPVGHAYIGVTPAGGPSNADLAAAASWRRVFPERKQIRIARLRTREF
jgi:hypothetical protein